MDIVGHVDFLSRGWAIGWACDLSDPDRELDVAISADGRELATVRANLPRDDLSVTGRHGSGRHGFVVAFENILPLEAAHHVSIKVRGASKPLNNGERDIAPVDVRRLEGELSQSSTSRLQPVFLTHVPRSGSTLLMDVLSRHPSVVVGERYPYEVKIAAYYANAAHVLSHPAWPDTDTAVNPTEFMRESTVIGFNPFNHHSFANVFSDIGISDYFFGSHAHNTITKFFESLTKQYYRCLAVDQRKSPLCFVEKCELDRILRQKVGVLFPRRREIVLVRDMRDVYCSYRSYFSNTTKEKATTVITNSARYLTSLRDQSDHRTTIFVRYEDCIEDGQATFDRIWEFLGIEGHHEARVGHEDALFLRHATSGSAKASIGRWRRDLSPDEQLAWSTLLSDFLSAYGYPT